MIFFTPNYTAAYTTGYVTKKYIPQRSSVRRLYQVANHWCQQLRRRIGEASEGNSWWCFIYQWPIHVIYPQSRQGQTQVRCDVHPRTCHRALDPLVCYQAKAMRQDAVHPAKMQRYLAPILVWLETWWSPVINQSKRTCITHWVDETKKHCWPAVWVGRGLLTLGGFRRDLFPPY